MGWENTIVWHDAGKGGCECHQWWLCAFDAMMIMRGWRSARPLARQVEVSMLSSQTASSTNEVVLRFAGVYSLGTVTSGRGSRGLEKNYQTRSTASMIRPVGPGTLLCAPACVPAPAERASVVQLICHLKMRTTDPLYITSTSVCTVSRSNVPLHPSIGRERREKKPSDGLRSCAPLECKKK